MKTDFSKRVSAVVAEAVQFLKDTVKKQKKVVLLEEDQTHDDDGMETEDFETLPTITGVSKHSFYEQFAVLSIERGEKEEVIIHTKSRGEDTRSRDFNLSELSPEDYEQICYLADRVSRILK